MKEVEACMPCVKYHDITLCFPNLTIHNTGKLQITDPSPLPIDLHNSDILPFKRIPIVIAIQI